MEKQFPKLVAAICGYEVMAIMSGGKIPTLTKLDQKYRAIGPVLVAGLLAHFYLEQVFSRRRLA